MPLPVAEAARESLGFIQPANIADAMSALVYHSISRSPPVVSRGENVYRR
jgi:hypothetical protein